MERLLRGFIHILIVMLLFTLIFALVCGVAWLMANTVWLNAVWVIPLFLGGCWIMGDIL